MKPVIASLTVAPSRMGPGSVIDLRVPQCGQQRTDLVETRLVVPPGIAGVAVFIDGRLHQGLVAARQIQAVFPCRDRTAESRDRVSRTSVPIADHAVSPPVD